MVNGGDLVVNIVLYALDDIDENDVILTRHRLF